MHICAYNDMRMSSEPGPVPAYEAVGSIFGALASPVRAAIVHRLTSGGWTVGALADDLGVSQPLVSQHLRVLRSARIVASERVGRGTTYTLVDEHMAHVFLDAFTHTEEQA